MKKKHIITSFLLLIFSILSIFLIYKNKILQKDADTFLVREVFDGDSFLIELNEDVRLVNLDAPQLKYCMGKEAKERLEELILHKEIRLEEAGMGEFNRILVFVYVDDLFINEIMVKEGYARYRPLKTNKKEIIKEADAYARENNLGIWGKCRQRQNPDNPNCNIKGNIEIRSKEKRYFFPGCTNYTNVIIDKDLGEEWFCTEKEAQEAGFERSGDCP